jgi:hypothetical protein
MEAAAHTKGGVGGVPQKVGKEFAKADEGKKFKEGGLYANIHKKQMRIAREKAEGKPVEHMRKPGSKGAPTAKAFEQSAKTKKMADGGSALNPTQKMADGGIEGGDGEAVYGYKKGGKIERNRHPCW